MEHALELGLIGSAWHGTSLGVLEGIAKTKEIGFDSYDVFEDPLTTSDDERREIKETCEELGLPIRSAVCIALGLVDFVPAVRRFTLDRCKAYIDQQAYFGGRNVLLVVGEYYCDLQVFSKEQIFGLVAENLRELAEHAEPQGIELAIELEPFKHAVANSVHELADLIRLVDHPAVKANADVSHLHLSGASFDDVAVLTGMIGHVHVSDCDGKVHGDMPPGRGVTPIKEYLQAILDTGYTGTVSVELERVPEPDRMVELVEEAYRETARILAELGAREAVAGRFDLTGRRALVTGGGGGIGRGMARALVEAGASVAILGRSESADEAAAELGGIAVRADLNDRDALRRGFADAVERLGGLDILVNSHGIGRASEAVDHDLADWDEVIEVNLTATFELCQLAGRIMVAQGSGKIVNIASRDELPGRMAHLVVRGEQGRRLAADDGARERVGAARRQRQRDRARLRQDGAERAHLARRSGADSPDRRPHPGRPLGRARRHRRRRRLPLLPRRGLRAGITLPVDGGWLSR